MVTSGIVIIFLFTQHIFTKKWHYVRYILSGPQLINTSLFTQHFLTKNWHYVRDILSDHHG